MTVHSVKKKLMTWDSKYKILIELTNNGKQMPLHPDLSSLFVVNIQETVFNYVCVHLEMSKKRRHLGRNCTTYSKDIITHWQFKLPSLDKPPTFCAGNYHTQHSCVCWFPSLLCIPVLNWSPKWLLFTVIFYALTRIRIDYVQHNVWSVSNFLQMWQKI